MSDIIVNLSDIIKIFWFLGILTGFVSCAEIAVCLDYQQKECDH
jgi:hypothetical protein